MHPFDGQKSLYHVQYWGPLRRGEFPPPVLVTLDPIQRCNLRCGWCNSNATVDPKGAQYSAETVTQLPYMLRNWGVRAVCIAGGGEPTLHPRLGELISRLDNASIEVGLVTNGLLLPRITEPLRLCRWVGVSVDAGRAEDYRRAKGVDAFDRVLGNMQNLIAAHPGLEVNYKYLIHPSNLHGLYEAAQRAKEIGCRYFHARPAGVTWQDKRRTLFTAGEVRQAVHLLNACAELADDSFKVVNTPDKFSEHDWGVHHPFYRCWAVGMTCVIQANGVAGLCCDRRGDPRTQLCEWEDVRTIRKAWGGDRHKEILESINLDDCPRCTYSPHNRLFEEFSDDESVCKWFI